MSRVLVSTAVFAAVLFAVSVSASSETVVLVHPKLKAIGSLAGLSDKPDPKVPPRSKQPREKKVLVKQPPPPSSKRRGRAVTGDEKPPAGAEPHPAPIPTPYDMVLVGQPKAADPAAARFRSVIRRGRMHVTVRGWIGDFFSYFEKAVNILTVGVKQYVLNTVNAFEDRAVALFNSIDALWTYFSQTNVDKPIRTLWLNTRCDLCQSALVHIYRSGCAWASQQICNIIDTVACGPYKSLCDKHLCPLIQKHWLQPECAKILSRLDAVLLNQQTGKSSVLDNFNTLAVCKRIGFCRAADQPFDGTLFQAVVTQAQKLNAAAAAKPVTKMTSAEKEAAITKANSETPAVTIPSMRYTGQSGATVFHIPGMQTFISIWVNIQVKSERYGKEYYMFWDSTRGGPASMAGIKEGWWLNAVNGVHIDKLGPNGVLEALNTPQPGQSLVLQFEVSGFFSQKFVDKMVTYTYWPVKYASAGREDRTPVPNAPAPSTAPAAPAPRF